MDILCDLDDVMWDLCGHWTDRIANDCGVSVSPNDITEWDMCRFYPTLTREQVYAPLFAPDFFKDMNPIEDARETVGRMLWEGDSFYVVTATHYKTVGAKIEEMLRLFPMLSKNDVFITPMKERIFGDILIDDSVENVMKFARTGRPAILFTRPHNKNKEVPHGACRCDTWRQIYRVIGIMECENIHHGKRWLHDG